MQKTSKYITTYELTEADLKEAITCWLSSTGHSEGHLMSQAKVEFHTEMSEPDVFGKVTATVKAESKKQ